MLGTDGKNSCIIYAIMPGENGVHPEVKVRVRVRAIIGSDLGLRLGYVGLAFSFCKPYQSSVSFKSGRLGAVHTLFKIFWLGIGCTKADQ